jgi:electron transport complex protein RnfB
MAKKSLNRRNFIDRGFRFFIGFGLAGLGIGLFKKSKAKEYVWQLDPSKCIQCGRCATSCIMTPSAVKCFHVYDMCGYCDLCGGYFRPEAKNLSTAAENQLCPTAAIERKFIEEPFFEYHIIEELCIGCAKCVKGCNAFGNGSLQLQVNHRLCVDCNECSIARDCPADAFQRVPIDNPYIFAGFSTEENKS